MSDGRMQVKDGFYSPHRPLYIRNIHAIPDLDDILELASHSYSEAGQARVTAKRSGRTKAKGV